MQSVKPEVETEQVLAPLDEDEMKELSKFDLTLKYGPCVGLTRIERWERAKNLGLEPPPRVYELLQRVSGDDIAHKSMLSSYPL